MFFKSKKLKIIYFWRKYRKNFVASRHQRNFWHKKLKKKLEKVTKSWRNLATLSNLKKLKYSWSTSRTYFLLKIKKNYLSTQPICQNFGLLGSHFTPTWSKCKMNSLKLRINLKIKLKKRRKIVFGFETFFCDVKVLFLYYCFVFVRGAK